MIVTPTAWAIEGVVQLPVIPPHVELTPGQARSFARSLESAADRAEEHTETLARMAAKVIPMSKEWQEDHGIAVRRD